MLNVMEPVRSPNKLNMEDVAIKMKNFLMATSIWRPAILILPIADTN